MGMATNQFFTDRIHHISKIEQPLLLGQLAIEDHLKQQVSQFTFERHHIILLYAVRHLIGFLQGVGHNRGEGLLLIPGTAGLRIPELLHDRQQLGQLVSLFFHLLLHGRGTGSCC